MTPLDRLGEDFDPAASGFPGPVVEAIGVLKVLAPELYNHGFAVGALSGLIAGQMGFDGDVCGKVEISGLLHDIGKLVEPRILHLVGLPRSLDEQEQLVVKMHPALGARRLTEMGVEPCVVRAVWLHHERLDGTGYYGFEGKRIGIMPKIVAVADTVHALTTKEGRSYRRPFTERAVIADIRGGLGTRFDQDVVTALLQVSRCRCIF